MCQLVEEGYIESKRDARDCRIKRLKRTAKGRRLEETLTGKQRPQLAEVFRKAGPRAQGGCRKAMVLSATALYFIGKGSKRVRGGSPLSFRRMPPLSGYAWCRLRVSGAPSFCLHHTVQFAGHAK